VHVRTASIKKRHLPLDGQGKRRGGSRKSSEEPGGTEVVQCVAKGRGSTFSPPREEPVHVPKVGVLIAGHHQEKEERRRKRGSGNKKNS